MLATQILKSEHQSIRRMLAIVQKAGNRLDSGREVSPQLFRDATGFFQGFVDKCHYSKEEEQFVPALEQAGVHRDYCAISLVLSEHERARQLNRAMAIATDRLVIGDANVRRTLVLAVRDYVNLIQPHMIKENYLVFRLADTMLPSTEQKRLLDDFEAIEDARLGAAARQNYEALLDEMEGVVAAWEHPLVYTLSPLRESVRVY